MSDINPYLSESNIPGPMPLIPAQLSESTISDNVKNIHTKFRFNDTTLNLVLKDNITFADAVLNYFKKMGINPEYEEPYFFLNSKEISDDSYNKSLSELNIRDGSVIEVKLGGNIE